MKVLFYLRGPEEAGDRPRLPPGALVRVWRPAADGFPPRGSRRPQNLIWWLFTRTGVFRRPDFAELSVWRDEGMLHRLVVTPRWRRFPFMGDDDLQLGDLWTRQDARRQGLARVAIAEAHRRCANGTGRFWYVVDAENLASIRLIESCGYRFVGAGRRTSPFGIRAVGQFRLEVSAV